MKLERNTPGTAGGPGGRDRTLAVKSRKNILKSTFLIFSSYAKILWGKLFRTREIPQSGPKAKDGEKRKKRERANIMQAKL